MRQKISLQFQLQPTTLPILELLEKVEATRESSRSMFMDACRLEGRTLVIPGRVFGRTYCKTESPFEAAFVDGRILLRGLDELPPGTPFYIFQPDTERRLELPPDFPLDQVQALLSSAVIFVCRQFLLIGRADDVPAELGRHRRVRKAPSQSPKTFQEDRVTFCQAPFVAAADAVVAWRKTEKFANYLRVVGGPLSVLGWKPGDALRMTVHPNGVLLERCAEALATVTLKSDRSDPSGVSGHFPSIYINQKYFKGADGAAYVATVVGEAVFLAAATPEFMALCPSDRGLGHSQRMGHRLLERAQAPGRSTAATPLWRIGGFHFLGLPSRAGAGATGNSALYSAPAAGGRLQLQGEWFRHYGFVPGARYRAIPAGQITAGPCLELCEDGEYTVTALTKGGGTPKLYVPAKVLQGWRDKLAGTQKAKFRSVRVAATALGLVLTPR